MLVGLAGCAETRIRSESDLALAAGDYERAVQALDEGLKDHPQSPLLRSGLLQARAQGLSQRIAKAAALRAAGQFDEAERELALAGKLDPGNARVSALMDELAVERRQVQALGEAERAASHQQPQHAQQIVQQALKDNPRHAGLLALQRRLQLAARQAQQRAAQGQLAETRPISLDFRDTSLRTVLDAVSRHSGVDFIFDRDVRQDVRTTVLLKNARVEEAIDLIVGTNQLAKKVVDPKTIAIYPNTPEKQREYLEQVVRVFHLASADAKNAAAFLKAMLKIREPFVDERSNMLALRESVENIQLAERLIALYDAGEPEVMLDVEVLEISSSRLTELGVKLPDSFSLTPLNPAGGASGLTLGNVDGLNRNRLGLGIAGILVNFKREVGDFNTLANPRIRVRNREKAKVLIGDKIPVITSTSTSTGFVSESVNYLDVGLKLDVEPTVFADDEVAIRVALEVSSLGTAVKTNSGTLAYQIGTRNAQTLLRLRDGETQLLAGLVNREDRSTASRVPGLGDLPVLGRLFSNQSDTGSRKELVLAITPRILRNIRRPSADEAELWVGTDALPRVRAAWGPPAVTAPVAEAVSSPPKAAVAAPPPISLSWKGPEAATAGQTLEYVVQLASSIDLRGLPIEVAYDRQRLQWVDASEADFFKRDGAPTGFSQHQDPASGRLKLGVLRSQATAIQGEGPVMSLRFKALVPGSNEIRIVAARPVGLVGPVPEVTLPAPITVLVK